MKEELLKKVFSSLHIMIAYLDPEFNFIKVNDAYAKGGGHEPEYYIGKNHFDLYPHAENEKIFRQVVETGESFTTYAKPFEYPDRPELGVTYWDWTLLPLKNKVGKLDGLLLSMIDVTAKERILKEYTRLAAAIENVDEGIIIFNKEKRILYVNPSFLRSSGFSKEELVGKQTSILRSDLYGEQFHSNILNVIFLGKVWKGTYRRQRKDKTYYDVDMTIYPLRDSKEKVAEFVIVERDITDDLKLQQRIRQIQKMEALGTLAAGVAHDFNNILMPIIVNTEMALCDVPTNTATQEYLRLSLDAAERGRELVKQIISFSKSSYQKIKPVKIGPIVEESLDLLKPSLPFNIKVSQRLGNVNDIVMADPNQIHQVLLNLFSNAVHAMRKKGGILKVELSNVLLDGSGMEGYLELKSQNYLKITVSDTGCGIPKEIIEKIFDPFFTTKGRGEGTGMGLSVVHGIIKSHNGTIEVHSEEEHGTTFDIFLPLSKENAEESYDMKGDIFQGNECILLVDDDENVLKSVTNVLKRFGYDVVGEKNGKDALRIFKNQSKTFGLVITDQYMPGFSGLELARKISGIDPDIPIVLCTGFSDKIDKKKLKKAGIHEIILKPVNTSELAQTIRRVLDETKKKI